MSRHSFHAAHFGPKDTLAGTSAPGRRAGSPTGPVARASLSFAAPARTAGPEAAPHLAVEVKALLGALTGWDNAVVMPPRCDVCHPDLAGVVGPSSVAQLPGTRHSGGGR